MEPSDDDPLEAWHEAAHGVVAHLLGGEVRGLTLEADEVELGGRAEIAWPRVGAEELASLSGRVALAGPIAELERFGGEDLEDPRVLASWEADWAEAERCSAAVADDAEGRLAALRGWVKEVQRMLGDPRVEETVARVADALAAHGTLDETLFADCLG